MNYIYDNDETNEMYKILEKTFFIYSFLFTAVISSIICCALISVNLYLFYEANTENVQLLINYLSS